jgi:hypothetical protein
MTLTEYKAWLDGMIAATGDEKLKVAREKLAEVVEAAPVVVPSPLRLDPFAPAYGPWPVTCVSQRGDFGNFRSWNGLVQ